MNIRKMPTIPTLPRKKQVAAYARVSSGKDAMLHSLSAQISYYSEYIQKQPEWLYCGVYVDEAVTGTKTERPEFQRLLSDCRAGKIDMIITKSISRFARNTVTLLATVRELKAIGVDVFFEEPHIMRRNKPLGNDKHPWKAEVTEGDSGVSDSTINNWFKSVYEPAYAGD